jgi:membrane fusion protein
MDQRPLFREEALAARSANWMGRVVLLQPLSLQLLTAVSTLAVAVGFAFVMLATYTKRIPVKGELVPSGGLIKVYAHQTGVVTHKYVQEGEPVSAGSKLYAISSDWTGETGKFQAAISGHVELRRKSLLEEIDKTRLVQTDERAELKTKIARVEDELVNLSEQISIQRRRAALSDEGVARYQTLANTAYIAQAQLQQKQDEALDQRSRLRALERERLTLVREQGALASESATLGLKQQNQLSQLIRARAALDQEFMESEAKRNLVITAPADGVATGVVAELGQTVEPGRPMLSIVPQRGSVQAYLYAPSVAIGFVKIGAEVLLAYDAFPYQKFGYAHGRVSSVSKVALPFSELTGAAGTATEPFYRITVTLSEQWIDVYGKREALQAGMRVNANIEQESRRLYEWILDPLYSLRGKL